MLKNGSQPDPGNLKYSKYAKIAKIAQNGPNMTKIHHFTKIPNMAYRTRLSYPIYQIMAKSSDLGPNPRPRKMTKIGQNRANRPKVVQNGPNLTPKMAKMDHFEAGNLANIAKKGSKIGSIKNQDFQIYQNTSK